MFSKACEYGIRATIYVAVQSLEDKVLDMGNPVPTSLKQALRQNASSSPTYSLLMKLQIGEKKQLTK